MAKSTNTANKWRLLAALVLGAAACWLLAPSASAHAAFESSNPGFAEILAESPSEISVRFTQELFRREGANSLELQQVHGDVVDEWDLPGTEISNDDRHVMRLTVDVELPPGRYLVSWRNLSAEDGDSDSGLYPFYVSKGPTAEESESDRQLAAELLITYPGDEVEQSESEVASPTAPPIVVRAESPSDTSLGVGPVIWFIVGIVAALTLLATLVFQRMKHRQVE